jgi:hypothetical protein
VPSSVSSAEWFKCYAGNHGFHNLKLTDKCVETKSLAAEKFPCVLHMTAGEHKYLPQQVFSLDETGFFWKQMLSRTLISVQRNTASSFAVSKYCYY